MSPATRLVALMRRVLSRRFLKFGTVGASGTVINLGVLYLAQEYIFIAIQPQELRLNLSLALAIFLATLNNFFWNRLWTWADRRQWATGPIPVQFGQYMLACWLSIALQAVFTNILAPHIHYLLANLTAIVLTSVLNFLVNDFWTFGRLKMPGRSAKTPAGSPAPGSPD
jgi:putative flippase GtrA